MGLLGVGKPIAIFQFRKRVEGRVVDFNASNLFDLQPDLLAISDKVLEKVGLTKIQQLYQVEPEFL